MSTPAAAPFFDELCQDLFASLKGDELAVFDVSGERTHFVRFTKGQVRQPGTVFQDKAMLQLVNGRRHGSAYLFLSGQRDTDQARLQAALGELREIVDQVPDDPHLQIPEVSTSEQHTPHDLPEPEALLDAVLGAAKGHDLVGICASGPLYRVHASSAGHHHRFSTGSYQLDYSLYAHTDKASKGKIAGRHLDVPALHAEIERAAAHVPLLHKTPKTVAPGSYRAYLGPRAMASLLQHLSWGGFSTKSHRTKQSCLLKLAADELHLSPKVHLAEDLRAGTTARFTDAGFLRPERVPLIEAGRLANTLASQRTAAEYGLTPNAEMHESPEWLVLDPGDLAEEDVFSALGTGLYISDLWYLNHSDPVAGRLTGMTRFASLWVENGVPVAPLAVMRFDDTLYRMLGSQLERLGAQAFDLPDADTYGSRQSHGVRTPGALLSGLHLVL